LGQAGPANDRRSQNSIYPCRGKRGKVGKMAKILRWVLLVFAAAALSPFVEPWVTDFLKSTGYYESPLKWTGYILNWIQNIVGEAAFPWVSAGFVGLAAGAWLDWIARKFDNKPPSKAERFGLL
jgi:hypothetical protein